METKNSLNITDFVYLLLATLANDSQIIDSNNKNKKIIALPVQYKQIIECILCADNGWKEEFSILINIDEYFEDHFSWEQKLALTMKQVLANLNKQIEYDFLFDKLEISFKQSEIDAILSKFPDEKLRNVMDHFASLLVDYIYTRNYQEEFRDFYADAVKKMHNIMYSDLDNSVKPNKKRVKKLDVYKF